MSDKTMASRRLLAKIDVTNILVTDLCEDAAFDLVGMTSMEIQRALLLKRGVFLPRKGSRSYGMPSGYPHACFFGGSNPRELFLTMQPETGKVFGILVQRYQGAIGQGDFEAVERYFSARHPVLDDSTVMTEQWVAITAMSVNHIQEIYEYEIPTAVLMGCAYACLTPSKYAAWHGDRVRGRAQVSTPPCSTLPAREERGVKLFIKHVVRSATDGARTKTDFLGIFGVNERLRQALINADMLDELACAPGFHAYLAGCIRRRGIELDDVLDLFATDEAGGSVRLKVSSNVDSAKLLQLATAKAESRASSIRDAIRRFSSACLRVLGNSSAAGAVPG